MAEYIERRDALKIINETSSLAFTREDTSERLNNLPAADVVEAEQLIKICFHEFCAIAGDSPCGCDGCPYGKYGSENGECYEEYKKRKIDLIRGDNNAAD